ncbi:MAG: aldo/keto reductase [Oscillospiraceae bacterium]|jgi:L-glyceraldehyde 3-phosphate reductase|nr:aldo/keto reductase [Oscillospiraceae bacterium]
MVCSAEDRYQRMKYKRCGRSGLALPLVSLGLWHNFGEGTPYAQCKDMILGAFDLGVTHFDLANNYGPPPGSAEMTFGRVMKDGLKRYRDEIIISTKAGYRMWPGPYGEWGGKKYLIASLDQSLSRMGLDYVDIFYHHRPDPDTPLEETMDALAMAVRQGKAMYVGISNYNAEQAAAACDILKSMGVNMLICQPRYNMFDRRPEEGLYGVLREHGVGSAPYSPLAQGLLTNRYLEGIPVDSRAAGSSVFLKADQITSAQVGKARRLNEIAQERGQTLAQMALAWLHRDTVTTTVIIGASKLSQIQDCAGIVNHCDFAADELIRIDAILSDGTP